MQRLLVAALGIASATVSAPVCADDETPPIPIQQENTAEQRIPGPEAKSPTPGSCVSRALRAYLAL